MFHLRDGLYFEQLPEGAVRIIKKENGQEGAPVIFDQTVDASQWSSVIASMSHYGEEYYGFYPALSFHRGDDVPSSAMPTEADKRRQWIVKDFARDTGPPYKPIECGLPILD